jgi:outer membrane lipoprotein-sorting protein
MMAAQRDARARRNYMHMRKVKLVCALALVLGAAAVSAQDAARGASLLAEARKALGGEERLLAVKTLDVRGEFKRAAGQNTIEGDVQIRIERPDKFRRDEDTSLPGGGPAIIRTEVLNGTTVWDDNTGRQGGGGFGGGGGGRDGGFGRGGGGGGRGDNPRGDAGRGDVGRGDAGRGDAAQGRGGRAPLDPAQIEDALRRARQADLTRLLLVFLVATDAPVTWIGTAEAPDGKADVLELTPANQPAIRLFLDATSHVPLMITWQAAGRGRGAAAQITQQMTLAEYKTVNGIRFPHLITRGTSEQTVEEWTIGNYRVNPSFRSDVFTK